ncbi:VOC family protein [Brachybacterium sp. ACRRE]|uniref:VOC family protein n=1 Tax=Brachybacterium sp. ACRRE TaxID=2918184 RepID=UPI001EF2F27A|nr:VOC family protein [Brachybacterium sp. ACRRE]MCG7309764.1 VOC family protein [Brachybacterium sp. ACRRE]
MHITKSFMVLDAADTGTEAAFWAAVLGGEVEAGPDEGPFAHWRDVVVDGRIALGVQHAPDHVAPEWPGQGPERQRIQIHPDLYVDHADAPAALQEVLDLGARMLQPAATPQQAGGFHVLADPAGHPFCICWE